MKKIIIWFIIIAFVVGLITVFFILKNRGKVAGAEKISSSQISNPFLFQDFIYYLNKDKATINKIDLKTGKNSEINNLSVIKTELGQISDVQIFWYKEQYLIRCEDEEPSTTNWYLGSISSTQIKKIPAKLTDSMRWKDEKNLVFIDYDNKIQVLNLDSLKETFSGKIDSQNVLEIFPSPDGEKAIIAETLEGEVTSSPVWIYYFKTKQLTNLSKTYIRNPLWSPGSQTVLFDKYTTSGQGKTEGSLIWSEKEQKQLSYGDALKTAWLNEDLILMALPQKNDLNSDSLYKIIPKSDGRTLVFESSNKERFIFENLMLAKDGKTLYFTSDDYLYKLNISKQ